MHAFEFQASFYTNQDHHPLRHPESQKRFELLNERETYPQSCFTPLRHVVTLQNRQEKLVTFLVTKNTPKNRLLNIDSQSK